LPDYLVANVNSTFSVYVTVENHLGYTLANAQVQVKVTSDSNPSFPIGTNATETFTGTVKDGASWENMVTVSINKPGDYLVVFEVWTSNGDAIQFSGDFTTLSVQVAAA
jgi:hypothetical protein